MGERAKRFICGFDSEDDGAGNPFLWCFTHDAGAFWTDTQSEALAFIAKLGDECHARGERLEIWASNLEYDLCNLFDDEKILEVRFYFGRQALCGASWKRADFRDTMRHLPVSVAALGEMVGLPKREKDLFKEGVKRTAKKYLVRCQRDATITYRAAKLFAETYESLGERSRMTLASTALNLWRSQYWKKAVSRPDDEVWEAALSAYHGGRTQAFSVGTFSNVKVVDAASMFPWAMTVAPLPLPWGLYRAVGSGGPIDPNGIYFVAVYSDLRLPLLPLRTKHGTVYPNGTWSGWYVGEELLAFQEAGGHVEVLRGFEFGEMCEPFTGYVDKLFAMKQAARGGRRTIAKLLLNSLYGKFGQQGKKVRCVRIEKMLVLKTPPLTWRPWRGFAIFSEEAPPPPWGNNVWPAIITARARVALWRVMSGARQAGCRVLYCDTDSVIFQGDLKFPKVAEQVGDFELRGTYKSAVVVGKKEYGLALPRQKWELHVKGVPLAQRERYLKEGKAEFSRPTRIRESSRTQERTNVWRTVTKERRTDLKRAARLDGSLPIPVYSDGRLLTPPEK